MLANGSLLLQPLSKDHHGGWECLATNRVATVSAGTVVMVLGEYTGNVSEMKLHFNLLQTPETTFSSVPKAPVLTLCHQYLSLLR